MVPPSLLFLFAVRPPVRRCGSQWGNSRMTPCHRGPGDLESVLQGGDTLFKGVRCFVRICTFKFEKPAAKWTKIVLTASLYIYITGSDNMMLERCWGTKSLVDLVWSGRLVDPLPSWLHPCPSHLCARNPFSRPEKQAPGGHGQIPGHTRALFSSAIRLDL